MKNKVNKNLIGKYIQRHKDYKSFTPFDFPPNGLIISPKLHKKHEQAIRLVGKLDGITKLLPDKDFFLLMFIKKDAAYSSQIEGTKATLQEAVADPVTDEKNRLSPDVDDIIHYVDAINYGTNRTQTLPISLRLIKEIHKRLMTKARSTQHAYPGEFRNSQNWINGKNPQEASFVPPAVEDMKKSLYDLENFIHKEDDYPSLIKAGLLHAQFETIHPFTDGNGRTGRILIALYIHHLKLLEIPILYLSSYFKKYQKVYYERLQEYHNENSEIDKWLEFFLEGISEIAISSIETCEKITFLRDKDFCKVQKLGKKSAESTLEIIKKLYSQPIIGVMEIVKWSGFTKPGAYKIIDRLIKLKILEPIGNVKYGQKYIYADYYEIFDDDYKRHRNKK